MRRRDFITVIGSAMAAWPLIARAQQTATPVIGFLNGSSATSYAPYLDAFIRGLAETGYSVGQNIAIEYRWAEGHYDRIPEMANDLVRHQVAVIAANTPAAAAAKRAAGKIPVVFFTGEDPVASGLVASLNRPGGNATGVSSMFGGLAAKQIGLLRELLPAATLIAFLVNPRNPITAPNVRDAVDAARKLGQRIEIVHASSEDEIDAAFKRVHEIHADALLAQPDAFINTRRLVELASHDAIPAMYQARELVVAGGLMSYGPSLSDLYRQMGIYVGKVLHGANPAELPVLQPAKFELVINLKTAKALGLEPSPNLLAQADEVIE
ncbi:MAG TPA: ABC transporter substrate-binding protein [Stellaceae bacterium]|nr:ABC transporter substrate-binding protein [Stellaceae bacterium]